MKMCACTWSETQKLTAYIYGLIVVWGLVAASLMVSFSATSRSDTICLWKLPAGSLTRVFPHAVVIGTQVVSPTVHWSLVTGQQPCNDLHTHLNYISMFRVLCPDWKAPSGVATRQVSWRYIDGGSWTGPKVEKFFCMCVGLLLLLFGSCHRIEATAPTALL